MHREESGMKSGNSVMVRQINREIIRDALKARESANIAEISRITGLSNATCSNILPELVESGEVVILKELQSQGGRPARCYAYNPDHALIAAILLRHMDGKTHIRHSVRNTIGATVAEGSETHAVFSLKHLDRLLDKIIARHSPIRAVAVSVPGVTYKGTVEICDVAELVGVNLEAHIRSRHDCETVTENDMNFAAVGFQGRHPETAASGLAYMVLPGDRCPGCGIVLGGILVKGYSNFAGELSYLPFASGGCIPCGFSDRGGAIRLAAQLSSAVIAVVNPGSIIITGSLLDEGMCDEIREGCLRCIPEQHLPRIIVKSDYEEDCFNGMITMSLNCLSYNIQLIERKRSWCGD